MLRIFVGHGGNEHSGRRGCRAAPGALVLVSNGVYAVGGRSVYGSMTNRVAVHKPVAVRSVNGPGVANDHSRLSVTRTTNGDGAIRCVYLTNNATVSGFTLTGGATRTDGDGGTEQSGGGVSSESVSAVVSNCVIIGNTAAYLGASGGTLINCVLTTNQASVGGAVYASTAINSAITNNTAGDQGGSAYAATLNGCAVRGNYAANAGGGAAASTLNDSILAGNSSAYGGGANDSILRNCGLTNNSASSAGGGVNGGTLTTCTLSGNTTPGQGGAANGATLNFCSLTGNSASGSGGGANSCNLNSCTVSGNSTGDSGGGASGGTLNNSAINSNFAPNSGGGVYGATLNNCTLTGNSAYTGGGASESTLNSCILFYNTASRGQNYSGGSLNYCCTTPLPAGGLGNIAADPQLAGPTHLSANSPCRAAGNATYATGKDLDGEAWLNPPSIGCDEFYSGSATGSLSVAIQPAYTNVATGYADNFAAQITGHPTASRWEFGDGTIVSNQPSAMHSWALPGDYAIVLRVYNTSNPGGVSATVTVHVVAQPVHYVALGNGSPVAPYTSWATAATNIQDAVNAATLPGALVLVTNGNYQSGGQVVFGAMTNRVAINKPVLVQSVNGPTVTVIRGTPTNSDSAVRCAYVSSGAWLSGFTLTSGATRADGDGDREQCGGAAWCESATAVLTNCMLTANTANSAGGAVIGGTLIDCTLSTNSAPNGGAVYLSELFQCTLTRNVATGDSGGAALVATLNNCTLIGNAAVNTGGGAYASTLNNCTLSGNSATNYGGGVNACGLNNCVLFGNSTGGYGGGAEGGTLNNCTLTSNSALNGGGVHSSTVNNSILFFNSAPLEPNSGSSTLNYCCTTPLPSTGTGNISADPQLAGLAHLGSGSPCRAAGNATFASGTDIDGEAWASPPSIGCDEYRIGGLTGSLSVAVQAPTTNFAVGFPANFTAQINGRVGDSRWEFGDGTIVSNQPFASHAWAAPGNYPVVLRAYNESNPGGITATVVVQVVTQPIHYVRASGSTPVSPYISWATAANNIQSAVDAASVSGALVLVSNGTYQTGGRVVIETTNRVAVTKPLIVQSVNGPAVTSIDGGGVMRCAYVASGAIMSGFTFTNGVVGQFEMVDASERNGGGVRCASLSVLLTNCVVTGCSGSGGGGGVVSGTLKDCTFSGNSISYGGGGVSSAILNNCMFLSNSAWAGGAASASTLNNCTLTGNGAWHVVAAWIGACLTTASSPPTPAATAARPTMRRSTFVSSRTTTRSIGAAAR
ncbi:MAG: PKD domain-containing protein [Verrucomicrobiota bacterium]